MANVITYGTFDLFHVGHLRLLQRAKALAGEGGSLVVAVSSDRFNWEAKRKRCVVPDVQRMEIVRALRCVDRVIAEESWEQKRRDVVALGIDLFVMGDDWKGKFDFLSDLCEVRYLARTPDISSTDLKAEIRSGGGLAAPASDTPYRYRGGVRPRCEWREARRFLRRGGRLAWCATGEHHRRTAMRQGGLR